MEKMKSALEIALEKAKNMGDRITRKETEKLEQQKYIQAALSLGNSFLQGKTKAETVQESLGRYPEGSREVALQAFLAAIVKEMNLNNTPEILEAILLLKEDAGVQENCSRVKKLHQLQLQQFQEKKATLQRRAFELLQKKMGLEGIKGSALAGFNVQHLPGWEETKSQLEAEYQKLLQDFRTVVLKP